MPDAFLAVSSMSWSGLSDITGVLLVAMFIIAGAFFGYALRGLVGRWKAEVIEKRMRIREEEAESEVKAKLKEADIAARAVVVKPKLVLADEPTGNLDSKNGKEVMDLLTQLNAEGTTVVMVTHSQHDASFATRTINLLDGMVVEKTLL